jgi:hypothetical protein
MHRDGSPGVRALLTVARVAGVASTAVGSATIDRRLGLGCQIACCGSDAPLCHVTASILTPESLDALVGRRITVHGHFVDPVTLDGVEDPGDAVGLRVRTADGKLHKTVLDLEEWPKAPSSRRTGVRLVPGDDLFDLVETQRIEHAYAHDPNLAVSMPRLRFVLADAPVVAHGG